MNERIGQKLGNYRLIRLLGQNSSAEVYLAEHVELKTQAAIKVLQTRLSTENQETFLTQARSLTRLKHPGIVQVLDAGVEGDTPFLVMDFVPYDTLREHYPTGTRLPRERVLSYIQQVAAPLQYAHDQTLMHRNVKPESMLLGPDNKVLLSDFGIALIFQSSRLQDMQEMVGTAAYLAPEQLKGKPCPASDQYALGIVTYEWLSGDCPFHGSFNEIARQHMSASPPSLHEKVPDIPLAVEEVVQIALAKDPKRRFGSVRAFANALKQACKPDQPLPEVQVTSARDLSTVVEQQTNQITQPLTEEKQTLPFSEERNSSVLLANTQQPLPTSPVPKKLPQRSHPPVVKAALLIILALLVATSGIGLIYYTTVLHPAQLKAQSTPTAQNSLAAPAQATAQARAYTSAEATAEASATAEARVTATAQQNLYAEATSGSPAIDDMLHYNNGNQWDVNTSSRGESCAFTGGAYHVIEPNLNYYYPSFYPCFANRVTFSNFAFQAQVTITSGDMGGLVFLADNTHASYCYFGIYSAGAYEFYCYVNGGPTFGLNSEGKAVGQKSPQSNLLTVIVRSNYISLYVNKQNVANIKENFLSTGEIGMFAQENTQPTDVAFSHAQVWNL
jgi:eukaryotic-like serine/threonine-protein kinase